MLNFKSYGQSATQISVSGTGSTNNVSNNVATVVDPNLVVTANGNVSGFIVSITDSYTSGDVLAYTGTLPSGVTAATFNTSTKSLVFSGTTSAANWQTLLRTVTIQTTSATCNPETRKVTFSAANKYYNPVNGHYYEYYSTTGSWTAAIAAASSKSYFGRQCYMATLSSAAENSFVVNLIGMNTWIGCTDNYAQINAALGYTAFANQAAADGNFYWITGPERGTKINSKNAWGSGGITPVSGVYNNWTSGEPNDWPGTSSSTPGEEDYGHMYTSSGQWNDFANTQSIGTIFEYGGMSTDSVSSDVHFTRNINITGAVSGTIINGNVSVCSGTNSTTLVLTGLSGSVVRWESSNDNFINNTTSLTGTSTSYTVSNITASTYYRAVVNTSSGCTNLATSSTLITVNTTVAGNVLAANSTICSPNTATFTLNGNVGSVTRWQVSTSSTFASGVTNISNTTNFLSYNLSSVGTFYFRATVQNSGCGSPVNTPGVAVSVVSGSNPAGGSVTSTEHCGGSSNSGTLTLSGHSGTISKWQYSVDGGVAWIDVANTTSTLNYSGVGENRLYRALLVSGSCGSAYSTPGSVTVYGTTVTKWVGSTSNAWQTASNWCGGIADNGMDIVVYYWSVYDLKLDQDRIVGNIDFNGTNKKIDIGNYNLTANSFTDGASGSYVKTTGSGKLKVLIANNETITLPVGNTSYNPITIKNRTGNSDYLSVRVFDEVYNTGYSGWTSYLGRVKRTWDISKGSANGGSGLDFVFNWNSGESVSLTTPSLYHYENGWSMQTGTTSSTSTSLTYTGYTGTFSPFAISNSIVPLPVNLIDFSAKQKGSENKTEIQWETSDEVDNQYFEVLKSVDGRKWTVLGRVESAGKPGTINTYKMIDDQPAPVTYYKLNQVDLNGKSEESHAIRVDIHSLAETVQVLPNPSKGLVEITANEGAGYSVYDMNGKLIAEGIIAGVVVLSDLESGIYIVRVQEGEAIYNVKLVVE
ncbi:MAG TPA: T9SS type A sorting domain-containing protein [Bacteroidia bacterium]